MKKIFVLLLTGVIFLSACGNNGVPLETPDEQPIILNEPETELPPVDEVAEETPKPVLEYQPFIEPPSVIVSEVELPESLITEEIPLADGAVLILQEIGRRFEFYQISFSVLYENSDEPVYLFTELFNSWFEIGSDLSNLWHFSPDLSKIAYPHFNYDHRGGRLSILNLLNRETIVPQIDGVENYKTGVTNYLWLNDEIMLLIITYVQGSATAGGSLHYYNNADGSNGLIIPLGEYFQIMWAEIDNNDLILTIILDSGEGFYQDNIIDERIPLTKIYELIENNESLIIDVPDIRE
jgi:hypothetical protein